MVNKIEEGYNEIIKWKKRFEKLFSAEVTNSRAFKLEELRMFERLLQRNPRGLNNEEKIFRKLIRQEKRNLVRSLYPNPLIRLIRNIFKTGASVLSTGRTFINGDPLPKQADLLNEQLKKTGFSGYLMEIKNKLNEGHSSFKLEQEVSPNEKERIKYILSISSNDRGLAKLDGFDVIHSKENGEIKNFKFDSVTGVNKDQAIELINGRAINSNSDTWKMIDFNDKDASGNYVIKEVGVPGFDLSKALEGLAIKGLSERNKDELITRLKDGKRMEVAIEVNGESRKMQLEVLPLKRSFLFFENGKRVTLDKLNGKEPPAQKQKLQVAHQQKPQTKMKLGH